MKKRIRKTGEIVDVISWTAPFGTNRDDTRDFVSYIDNKGRERVNVPMNFYWEFEDVEEVPRTDIDWEQRRYEIAKTVVHGQLTGPIIDGVDPNPSITDLAKLAVKIADALISELKEGGEK